jgi:cell division transport system ATP-binding protein
MVNRPPLLICDEPTGNLDPVISEGIMQLLERINKTGTTVICSTHDRETVEKRRQRVIAFKDGKLVYDKHNSGYVQPAVIASEATR